MSCGEADHWMYANGRALERIEILWDKDGNIQGYTKEMALKQRDKDFVGQICICSRSRKVMRCQNLNMDSPCLFISLMLLVMVFHRVFWDLPAIFSEKIVHAKICPFLFKIFLYLKFFSQWSFSWAGFTLPARNEFIFFTSFSVIYDSLVWDKCRIARKRFSSSLQQITTALNPFLPVFPNLYLFLQQQFPIICSFVLSASHSWNNIEFVLFTTFIWCLRFGEVRPFVYRTLKFRYLLKS